ncbi:MAG: hypothetical protein LBJ14_01470 [Desulfarculales bacterium]|jgi:hypothetical protein|nr:hypothetical protein [Desulfarculales bacterium]
MISGKLLESVCINHLKGGLQHIKNMRVEAGREWADFITSVCKMFVMQAYLALITLLPGRLEQIAMPGKLLKPRKMIYEMHSKLTVFKGGGFCS